MKKDILEKEFQYYKDNQDELVKKYNGKYLVMRDCNVVIAKDTEDDAYREALKNFELGTFFLIHCTPGEEAYTQNFFSTRVIFA